MSRISKLQNWLETETNRDKKELDKAKSKLINEIKSIKKEDLFKKDKLTFWQRLKKVFTGQ